MEKTILFKISNNGPIFNLIQFELKKHYSHSTTFIQLCCILDTANKTLCLTKVFLNTSHVHHGQFIVAAYSGREWLALLLKVKQQKFPNPSIK